MLGDSKMMFRQMISSVCVICCALVLQSGLVTQASGKESPVAKLSAESDARQTPSPLSAPTESNEPAPKIFFENTEVDLGYTSPGSSNSCEFKFQNKGTGTLVLNDIIKTCGCTVPTLEKKEYAPGEPGTIAVRYEADRGAGIRTRRLYVLSNDKTTPRVELTIKASIIQKVAFEPEQLNYTLKGENAGVAELTIRSIDDKSFAIVRYTSTSDAITVDFDPSRKAKQFVLKTKIDDSKIGANNNGRLEITLNHPDCPVISVPFSALPRFHTEPPAINIINAEPGQPVQKELWVLSNYDEDFEISSLSSKEGITKLVSQEKLGNRYKLDIEIIPPTNSDPLKMFTDTLSLSTKDGDKINIACRGFFRLK
jgi:hypothetical protein